MSLAGGSAILPPTVVMKRDGVLVQLPTGFAFPPAIASIPRSDVRVFDPAAYAIGATYRSADSLAPWATLLSFPSKGEGGIYEHFLEAEDEMAHLYRNATTLSQRRFAVAFEGAKRALGMSVEVSGACCRGLPDDTPAHGWLFVVQTGNWLLKARVSARAVERRLGTKLLESTIREAIRPFLETVVEAKVQRTAKP